MHYNLLRIESILHKNRKHTDALNRTYRFIYMIKLSNYISGFPGSSLASVSPDEPYQTFSTRSCLKLFFVWKKNCGSSKMFVACRESVLGGALINKA